MKKILFVATVVKTHIMEFHVPYLKMMKEEGWETSVVARNDYDNKEDCCIPYCDNYFDVDFARFPFHPKNIKAFKNLKRIITDNEYDIIHCHTPVGGVLARLASIAARKKGTKVIYTAHGFHFYRGAPLLSWIIFYPIEWVCSFFTDTLITINSEDYEFAKKHMHSKQIEYIPGVGIDLDKFECIKPFSLEDKLTEIGVEKNDYKLLTVAELTKNKNHRIVFEAIKKIKEINPEVYEKIQYIVCGRGSEKKALNDLANEYGINEHIKFLGYRTDVNQIYMCADVFVFMSFREGLSLALMEAMSSGLPIIASSIRGNNDLIENNVNGILISHDVDKLVEAILTIDKHKELGKNAKASITKYSLDNVVPLMKDIYGV